MEELETMKNIKAEIEEVTGLTEEKQEVANG